VTHSWKISIISSPVRWTLPSERLSSETDGSYSTEERPGGVADKDDGKISSEAVTRSANA
jgi:hypothetical protein